ncbi:conserved hypothetical protein [Gammaproteobacteria bacterium]
MKFDPNNFGGSLQQLALNIKVEEVDAENAGLTDVEKARRSQEALMVLKDLLSQGNPRSFTDVISRGAANSAAWADEFYQLLDYGWPWRIAVYIAWASSPKDSRYPKTQAELATKMLGLTSDRAISTWRTNNPGIDEAIGLMQAAPLLNHRREVFEALAKAASDKSFHGAQDRKTFLTMTNDYVPHQKVEFEKKPGSPVEMSDAELDDEIKKLESQKNGDGDIDS